jgi:hypothetical protein
MNDLYGPLYEEKRKLTKKPSSEKNLGDWFKRKGAPGKKGGWVDCNTCRDGKCKPCGRSNGESRSKKPRCRPTPSGCKGFKNEELYMDLYQIIEEEIETVIAETHTKEHEKELEKISGELHGASKMHKGQADRIDKILDQTDDEGLKEGEGTNCGCGNDPCETYGKNNEKIIAMIKEELESALDEEKNSSAKKDACYNKVKSRYKVWPSAYASGALVKCRKVGAANWGNSKKESLNIMVEDELSQVLAEIEEEKEITPGRAKRDADFSKAVKRRLKNGEISRKQAEEAYKKRGMKAPGTLKYLKNEETDPKPCKPSKGKRFAKRVDGKCRSYGQKGQAKSGGDRIRPGTKKGDAYCARSAKIKKCKNPPCANALSRKKWKCRGSKSMKE